MTKISGLEEIQNQLSRITEGLSIDGMTNYSNLLVNNIILSCNMDKDDISITPKNNVENIEFEVNIKNIKDFFCFKKAFIEIVDNMPFGIKNVFLHVLETIENKYNKQSD